MKLTDGIVAEGFRPDALVGRSSDEPWTTIVEFGEAAAITEAGAWVLGGGLYAIWCPAGLSVAAEIEGAWQDIGTAAPPSDEPGNEAVPAYLSVSPAQPVHTSRLRFTFEPGRGWTMVSELVVRGD